MQQQVFRGKEYHVATAVVQNVHEQFSQGEQDIDRSLGDAAKGEWLNLSAWCLHGVCAAGNEWDLVPEQGLRIARTK